MNVRSSLPDNFEELPKFQQLQYLFAAHIRNPEEMPYQADRWIEGANTIETRRLKVYEELFFNNVQSFFSGLFPVLQSILGEERWIKMIREYMEKHQARTPLFHELGQEFLLFLQHELTPDLSDPPFMFELAHYEWVELALTIEGDDINTMPVELEGDVLLRLARTAMPLHYQWPVNQISLNHFPETMPQSSTMILAYRSEDERIEFMEISPGLFMLLNLLVDNESKTYEQVLEALSLQTGQDVGHLRTFSDEVIQQFLEKGIILATT